MTHITHITCPHCNDTYPTFDAAHVCSKGPYAPKLKPKMNERIRRLMEQAVISIDGQTFGKTYIPDAFTEKFAEMIVRQCAELANEETSLPYDSYSEKIKRHFGVEE
jgi:hypothetical protein